MKHALAYLNLRLSDGEFAMDACDEAIKVLAEQDREIVLLRDALEKIKAFGHGKGHGCGYSCATIAEEALGKLSKEK